jgi:hypothetical protein
MNLSLRQLPRIGGALFLTLVMPQQERLELQAFWEPCVESKYGLFEASEVLRNVVPAEERRAHGAEAFAPFLPPESAEVGDAWEVDAEAVLIFLTQFHPGARVQLHHGFGAVPGTYAMLRAASDEYLEVLIRAHAEFELEGGVIFTPGQFEGRLIVERQTSRPVSLRLALPSRNTNVDVNVPHTFRRAPDAPLQKTMAADIGWVPRMELVGGERPDVEWKQSVPIDEARKQLARSFYAFAAIDWLPFDEAVMTARELDQPLHVIVLFGTLDDESC